MVSVSVLLTLWVQISPLSSEQSAQGIQGLLHCNYSYNEQSTMDIAITMFTRIVNLNVAVIAVPCQSGYRKPN